MIAIGFEIGRAFGSGWSYGSGLFSLIHQSKIMNGLDSK